MVKSLIKYGISFILLVLLQVLFFNNIELGGYLNPYVYILFIIVLPFDSPKWLILISGFLLGLSVDIFSETLGMHTAATTFMAFLRPAALSMFAPREGYEVGSSPRAHFYGMRWFTQYSFILILGHHTLLFLTELFRVGDIFPILLRIILSTAFSLSLISISQYFVFRK